MEITKEPRDKHLELRLKGRFDANWSEHVANAIDEAIRSGQHHIVLNFSQVDYISSLGIRVIMSHHKQLVSVRGSFLISEPMEAVLKVFKLAGLSGLISKSTQAQEVPALAKEAAVEQSESWEREGVHFTSYGETSGGPIECRIYGQPSKLASGDFSQSDSTRIRCDADVVAVGLGAFGAEESKEINRFGEFLSVAGYAVALPTDGSSVPDYQGIVGSYYPEADLLYGITATGSLGQLLRFEASAHGDGVIGLSELVEASLEKAAVSSGAFVIIAESAGVVGASLRRSPSDGKGASPFSFPEVRDWISFTTESDDERAVVVIVGFAERDPTGDLAPFLRPIGPGTSAHGHFHGVIFPYRPLAQGMIDLHETVDSLISSGSARSVMHLMADERKFEGVGETDLMRGACWIAPISSGSSQKKG